MKPKHQDKIDALIAKEKPYDPAELRKKMPMSWANKMSHESKKLLSKIERINDSDR